MSSIQASTFLVFIEVIFILYIHVTEKKKEINTNFFRLLTSAWAKQESLFEVFAIRKSAIKC